MIATSERIVNIQIARKQVFKLYEQLDAKNSKI